MERPHDPAAAVRGGRVPAHVVAFVRAQPLAVEASRSAAGGPQAAVVGIVSNDGCEIFFDTLDSTRKCHNLRRDPRAALVIGWDLVEGRTVQLEGVADEPTAQELDTWKQLYFARFPDGLARESWPGITYFRVRPSWLRYSDFTTPEPTILEYSASDLSQSEGG